MKLRAYTTSAAYRSHLDGVFDGQVEFSIRLPDDDLDASAIHIVQASSFGSDCKAYLKVQADQNLVIAIGAEKPHLAEMLEFAQMGVKAYFNCFMQATHYQQLKRLLENGQSWYPPHLLQQTFELAQQAANSDRDVTRLQDLTEREREVSELVSQGLSNREIANHCDISERTVKTHLTNIFKKLDIKDRVGLVLHMK